MNNKKIKLILMLIIILIVCSISIFLIFRFKNSSNKNKIDFQSAYERINMGCSNSFNILTKGKESIYLPINFNNIKNYIFAYDELNDEYFIIFENIDEEIKNEINNIITLRKQHNQNKDSILYLEKNNYIIVINSKSCHEEIINRFNAYFE